MGENLYQKELGENVFKTRHTQKASTPTKGGGRVQGSGLHHELTSGCKQTAAIRLLMDTAYKLMKTGKIR